MGEAVNAVQAPACDALSRGQANDARWQSELNERRGTVISGLMTDWCDCNNQRIFEVRNYFGYFPNEEMAELGGVLHANNATEWDGSAMALTHAQVRPLPFRC